jgi:hypothetical protein
MTKRRRNASPDDVLRRRRRRYSSPSPRDFNDHPLEFYYVDEGERQLNHPKWRVGVFQKAFSLTNLHIADRPYQLFETLIREFIVRAVRSAQQEFGAIEGFSCIIKSPRLKKSIQVPYRSVRQNTPEAVMNLFMSVQQSFWPVDLLGGPLRVEIITIPRNPRIRTDGSGRKRVEIINGINHGSLIKVNGRVYYRC